MSDGETLLVVLAFLYLSDCFAWLKKGSVAVASAWGGRFGVKTGAGILGNSRSSLLPLNPLPPFGQLYIAHPLPISISPDGICAGNLHSVAPGVSASFSAAALAFEQVTAVSADGPILRVNKARFAKCGSAAQAAGLAELIKASKAAKSHKREHLIREFLGSHLSKKSASKFLDDVRAHVLRLTVLTTPFFLFLFLFVPWMATRTSASAVLIRGAIGAVLLAAAIGFFFYRAHSKLFPRERFERISSVIKMVLCPPMAIQAVNHLTIPLLATFHPVVVISILRPADTKPFIEGFLRRIQFPLAVSISDPVARRVCQWFGELQAELVTRFLQESDPELLKSAFSPPAREGKAAGYCPRCLSQYESSSADCPDCPGVKVAAFPPPSKSPL
jgi:hypothetical protein